MVKPSLKFCLLSASLVMSFMNPSSATMATLDAAAVAKAVEQLNALKEQIEVVNDVRDTIDEQLKTIGEFGKITLPIFNTIKMGNQLKKDMQCLMPDWKQLMPELNFDEQSFSICDKSSFYRDSLFVDPIKIGGESVFGDPTKKGAHSTDWRKWEAERQKVTNRRFAVLHDTVTNGLGQADMVTQNTEVNSKSIDDLQASVDSAQTEQDRLQTIAQGEVINARIGNQRNQILGQLLKVASAFVLEAGIPLEKYGVELEEGAKE